MSLALSQLLASPNAALLAVLAGVLLLYAEFNLPGTILPGCLGALSLMLGLFFLSRLPLSWSALGLGLAGLVVILLAIFSQRALLLVLLGGATLACSLLHLVRTTPATKGIDLPTALFAASLFSSITVWLGRVALRARRNKQIPARILARLAE